MVAARVRLSAGRALTAGLAGVVTVTVLALERSHWLPAVLIGLLVTAVLGSVVNDSGVAVFAAVTIVGLPLLVATLADEVVVPVVEPAKENDSPLGSVHDR